MAQIGKRNSLRVLRESIHGAYLDGEQLGEILLPRRYLVEEVREGDALDVFIHHDSEDRLVATTEAPFAQVGECACLKVASVHPRIGAFLEWGLSKDLLLPLREQLGQLWAGDEVVVAVCLDTVSDRIIASARLNRHLGKSHPPYKPGQSVNLLIADQTPLGYKAIVENQYWGLFYRSETSVVLPIGKRLTAFVREVRPDGKVDLRLDPAGYRRISPLTDQILEALKANGGRLNFDDSSDPAAIRETFSTSKKAFKQALGALFRARKIRFVEGGTELT